jgi:RNA polymerase sigma factor (sigma-70 family)
MTLHQTTHSSIQQKALAHWELVNKLAYRRFQQESIAEEAALYVLTSLEKDNWKKLRQFSGKSSFSTFFSSVAYRLLEDFSRKRFGRLTPPQWIKEAGGIWMLLFRLLCMERFSFSEAIEIAKDRQKETQEEQLESAAETILGEIPQCGKSNTNVSFEEEEILHPETLADNYSIVENKEKQLLLSAIAQEIFGNPVKKEQESAVQKLLKHKLSLSGEERILLKLCFQENYSVTQAGKILGINRFQAHGRLRRLLSKIRQHYKNTGCEGELRSLLQ